MCGIFGLVVKKDSIHTYNYQKIFKRLFLLSESRGKEASGFAAIEEDKIVVYKTPLSSHELIKSDIFKNYFNMYSSVKQESYISIGHSRLVTNGYEHFNKNNQPFVKNGVCVVHNGIIVNQADIWESLKSENRLSELDTELIPTIIFNELLNGKSIENAMSKLFSTIYGMTSTAMIFDNLYELLLATNNGSLYYTFSKYKDLFIFASEEFILKKLISNYLSKVCEESAIINLNVNNLFRINLKSLDVSVTKIFDNIQSSLTKFNVKKIAIKEIVNNQAYDKVYLNTSFEYTNIDDLSKYNDEYEKCKGRINNLIRCTKCILPETFPFIKFNEEGVCNYCIDHIPIFYKGKEMLSDIILKNKKSQGRKYCLVPLSGGRDSCYALHFVKNELGIHPMAYSYDWGMVTDLARRNQSRMCGKLGVEHIYISADIRKKRNYINKNVLAWLRKPSLGTIPLFMAGDKHYFYHAYQLKKNYNIDFILMGENHLEKTGFKTAFTGAKQKYKGTMAYHIDLLNKFRITSYYFKEYLTNPAYLNSSLFDTFTAFISYYVYSHDYINLYDYIKWDEKLIIQTLVNEYGWETDPGTNSTWRIGDGTASFYNYIYYMVSGFTENDTFRSNQIREGIITRSEALKIVENENSPRWNSIKWYLNTISIDFDKTFNIINKIPKLYL